MRLALEDADLTPADVDYVNAHATSTPAGDLERGARDPRGVRRARRSRSPVSATKSMTGHLLGAAGAVEALLCIRALESGIAAADDQSRRRRPGLRARPRRERGAPGRRSAWRSRTRSASAAPTPLSCSAANSEHRRDRAQVDGGTAAWHTRATPFHPSRAIPWATRSSSRAITAAPGSRPRCASASRRRATRCIDVGAHGDDVGRLSRLRRRRGARGLARRRAARDRDLRQRARRQLHRQSLPGRARGLGAGRRGGAHRARAQRRQRARAARPIGSTPSAPGRSSRPGSTTPFEGGRHARRVEKIDRLSSGAGSLRALEQADPEIADCVRREARRQATSLELIASENFVSEAVLEAAGSVCTNKYAEGYPGRRYYGGCEVVDEIETARDRRARRRCSAPSTPTCSRTRARRRTRRSTARCCEVGDTVLAMNLDHGGHLTHGSPVNFSGKLYRIVPYGVRRDTEQIDYDELRRLALEHRPKHDPVRHHRLLARARLRGVPLDRRRGRRGAVRRHRAHRGARRRPGCTRARSARRRSSPPPRTRRCAGRAAA